MKNNQYIFFILILTIILSSCQEFTRRQKGAVSSGKTCEIIVVMDEDQWMGELGETVKDVFMEDLPGVPRKEARFSLRYVKPGDFKGYIKNRTNILIVNTFDNESSSSKQLKRNFFSEATLQKIKEKPQYFLINKENTFAKGQFLMLLFGQTEEQLINNLYNSKENLQNYFYAQERKRLNKKVFAVNEQKKLNQSITEKYELKARIPAKYVIAKEDKNFMWLRKPEGEVDWHIYFAVMPYTSEKMFEEEMLLEIRDSIGRRQLNDRSLDKSYMMTETYIPPKLTKMKLNGAFAMEYRGLWRLKNATRGGAFIAYAFTDSKAKNFYYVEGFIYAPSKDKKRTYILELETILRQFKPK